MEEVLPPEMNWKETFNEYRRKYRRMIQTYMEARRNDEPIDWEDWEERFLDSFVELSLHYVNMAMVDTEINFTCLFNIFWKYCTYLGKCKANSTYVNFCFLFFFCCEICRFLRRKQLFSGSHP